MPLIEIPAETIEPPRARPEDVLPPELRAPGAAAPAAAPEVPVAPIPAEAPLPFIAPAPPVTPEEVPRTVLPQAEAHAITRQAAADAGLDSRILYSPNIESTPNRIRQTLSDRGLADTAQMVHDRDLNQLWVIGNRFSDRDELNRALIEEIVPGMYPGTGLTTTHDPADPRLGFYDEASDRTAVNTAQLQGRPAPLAEAVATANHELVAHRGFGILMQEDPETYLGFLNGFRRRMDSKGATDQLAQFKGFANFDEMSARYGFAPDSQVMNEELFATYVEKNFPHRRDFDKAPDWFTNALGNLADSISRRFGLDMTEWQIQNMVRDSFAATRDNKAKLGVGATEVPAASLRGDIPVYPSLNVSAVDDPDRANIAKLELGRPLNTPELDRFYDRLEGAGLPVGILNSPRGPMFLNYGENQLSNTAFAQHVAALTADAFGAGDLILARNEGTYATSAEALQAAAARRFPFVGPARGGAVQPGAAPAGTLPALPFEGAAARREPGVRQPSSSNPAEELRVDRSGRVVTGDSNAGFPRASLRAGEEPGGAGVPPTGGGGGEPAGEPGGRREPVQRELDLQWFPESVPGTAQPKPVPSAQDQLVAAQLERTREGLGPGQAVSRTAEQVAAGATGATFGERVAAARPETAVYEVRPWATAVETEAREQYNLVGNDPVRAFDYLRQDKEFARTDAGLRMGLIAARDIDGQIRSLQDRGMYDAAATLQHQKEKFTTELVRNGGTLGQAFNALKMFYLDANNGLARFKARIGELQERGLTGDRARQNRVAGAYAAIARVRRALTERAIAELPESFQARINAMFSNPQGLWNRYVQVIAQSIDSDLARRGVPPRERAAIERFADELRTTFRQLIRPETANLPEEAARVPTREQRSTFSTVADLLNNWDQANRAWQETVTRLKTENPNAIFLQGLDNVLRTPFSEEQARSLVRESSGVDIRALAREHYSAVDRIKNTIADALQNRVGVDTMSAYRVQQALDRYVNGMVAAEQQRQIEAIMQKTSEGGRRPRAGELQQLVRLANLGMLSKEEYYNAIADRFGLPAWDDAKLEGVRLGANELQKIQTEGGPRFLQDRASAAIADALFKMLPARGRAWAQAHAVWMASLLTGPFTHVPYWIQTAFQTMINATFRNVAAMARGKYDASDALATLRDIGNGAAQGLREFRTVFGTGLVPMHEVEPRIGALQMRDVGELPFRNPLESQPLPGGRWNYLNYLKYVPRFLEGMSNIFRRSAEYSVMRTTAMRLAQEHGYDLPQARALAEELIYGTDADRAAAKTQADSERARYNLSDRQYVQRLDELNQLRRAQKRDMDGNPVGEELVDQVNRYGLHTVYREPAAGMLGALARKLAASQRVSPALGQIVPFINLPTNIIQELLNWTPLGMYRAGRLARYYQDVPGTDFSRMSETEQNALHDEFMLKGAIGSVGMGAMFAVTQAMLGDSHPPVEFHGQGPSDPDQRRVWRAAGNLPYSIRLGDVSIPLENTPFRALVAAIGGYNDYMRYDLAHVKPGQEMMGGVSAVFMGALKSTLQASYLTGLESFLSLLSDRGFHNPGEAATDWLAQQAGTWLTIPMGGTAARQIQKAIDPKIFESKGFLANLLRNVPLVNDAFLAPRFNALGDPVTAPSWDRLLRTQTSDPVYRFLADHNVKISMPAAAGTYMPSGQMMNQEEFNYYIQRRGAYIKERLAQDIPELETLPADQRDDAVNQMERDAAANAKYDVVDRFGYGEEVPPTTRRHHR